ncbi:MAG: carboxypeptidase regulatory-like domain-containing protein, partial [candidate division WOR-3 bacterium]|nr:carboxypeptidase regulatory-like domain-containing protein [candidate division WOR-3 bacterium]
AQDAAFGIFGNIGTTIETQYPTTQAKVDSVCLANRRALMAMITRAGWGISGIVRDSITQTPLFAMVKFINPKRWTVYTDKQVGDFHKMLPAGNYTFRVEANGYQPKTLTVTVPVNGTVDVTIDLIPDSISANHIQKLIWVRRDRPDMVFRTITIDGLGIPDSNYYSLGPTGQIVLEADPPIRNFPGSDFFVYEGDATPEYYTVSVSNDWRGTFYSYGSVSGTQAFDLATVGLDSARYLKIVNAGGGSSSDPYAGFDLDGISYRQNPLSYLEEKDLISPTVQKFIIYPNPAKTYLNIKYLADTRHHLSPIFKMYNVAGKIVRTVVLANNAGISCWQMDISKLPTGIYFGIIDDLSLIHI